MLKDCIICFKASSLPFWNCTRCIGKCCNDCYLSIVERKPVCPFCRKHFQNYEPTFIPKDYPSFYEEHDILFEVDSDPESREIDYPD